MQNVTTSLVCSSHSLEILEGSKSAKTKTAVLQLQQNTNVECARNKKPQKTTVLQLQQNTNRELP
jgi:hypothetical protein